MRVHESLLPHLECPICHSGALKFEIGGEALQCENCLAGFPIVGGRPVLLRPDNQLFRVEDYAQIRTMEGEAPLPRWSCMIPAPSVNLVSERVLARLRDILWALPVARVLVIGGGLQRKRLDRELGAGRTVIAIYSDIDINADVDVFCDGHDLPFAAGVFDAVVTTAVLEHVLYPERVAAEIHRVLKIGGLIYSELPFMQQVHEGAYDFTRYSLSGHRRLLNGFSTIECGMVAGPGTALAWAIEHFVLAFVSNDGLRKLAKAVVRFGFAWIKYFDFILAKRPEAMDGASCTYVLGRKIDGIVSDSEIISSYAGGGHTRHT